MSPLSVVWVHALRRVAAVACDAVAVGRRWRGSAGSVIRRGMSSGADSSSDSVPTSDSSHANGSSTSTQSSFPDSPFDEQEEESDNSKSESSSNKGSGRNRRRRSTRSSVARCCSRRRSSRARTFTASVGPALPASAGPGRVSRGRLGEVPSAARGRLGHVTVKRCAEEKNVQKKCAIFFWGRFRKSCCTLFFVSSESCAKMTLD
jgi:hypothetical protein